MRIGVTGWEKEGGEEEGGEEERMMGRGRRRGEMREARRRDHAGRGAEVRHRRTEASPQATAPRIHSFLGVVLQILLFGIHLVAADGMHFI